MSRSAKIVLVSTIAVTMALLIGGAVFLISVFLDRQAETEADERPPLPSVWPTKDGREARTVANPGGELLMALPRHTSADLLCGALPPERWEQILERPALREVRTNDCSATTGSLDVKAMLITSSVAGPGRSLQVAGHQATMATGSRDATIMVTLAEVDPELKHLTSVLSVTVTAAPAFNPEKPPSYVDYATKLAEALTTAIVQPGPKLPQITGKRIPVEQTEPGPIADQPITVISGRLCAALSGALGVPPTSAKAEYSATCSIDRAGATYYNTKVQATGTVAGLPASIEADSVTVELNPLTGEALRISAKEDVRELAEKIVPQLL